MSGGPPAAAAELFKAAIGEKTTAQPAQPFVASAPSAPVGASDGSNGDPVTEAIQQANAKHVPQMGTPEAEPQGLLGRVGGALGDFTDNLEGGFTPGNLGLLGLLSSATDKRLVGPGLLAQALFKTIRDRK